MGGDEGPALPDLSASGTTAWELTSALLGQWRKRPAEITSGRDVAHPLDHPWAQTHTRVWQRFESRSSSELGKSDVEFVSQQISDNGWDGLHATAWALDRALSWSFVEDWKRLVTAGGSLQYEPGLGELYPVSDPDKGWLEDRFNNLSSRMDSNHDLTEDLPHVRSHTVDCVITFDFSMYGRLQFLMENLRSVATCHVNEFLTDEFEITSNGAGVRVEAVGTTPDTQSALLQAAFAIACSEDLVVFPELSVPESTIDILRDRLNDLDDDHLFVFGSCHLEDDGLLVNRSVACLPDSVVLTHHKFEPFIRHEGRPTEVREGIDRRRAAFTVWVAGPFRLTIAICKDFLIDHAVPGLIAAGVNVVAVPAMSQDSTEFGARVAQLVAGTQGIVVVANGPAIWPSESIEPELSVVGMPEQGNTVRTWRQSADTMYPFVKSWNFAQLRLELTESQ